MSKLALVLAMCLLASMSIVAGSAGAADSATDEAAYGAGSVLGTVLYAPFKTSFCVVGAVTSGLTLPFGGTQTAGKVASAACGGTWAITPDVLKRKEALRFVGGGASPTVDAKRYAGPSR
jgi:hypothetical protein